MTLIGSVWSPAAFYIGWFVAEFQIEMGAGSKESSGTELQQEKSGSHALRPLFLGCNPFFNWHFAPLADAANPL